jgi:serine/threonine protein kinase
MGNGLEKLYKGEKKEGKVLIGQGMFANVYLDLKTNKIIKYVRLLNDQILMPDRMTVESQGWNEVKILDNIRIEFSPEEQKYFPTLLGYRVSNDNSEYAKPVDLNFMHPELIPYAQKLKQSKWVMEIETAKCGRKVNFDNVTLMTDTTKLFLLSEMLEILIILKNHKIVHGDMHLGNILINDESDDDKRKLILIDFGDASRQNNELELELKTDLIYVILALSNDGGLMDILHEKEIRKNKVNYAVLIDKLTNENVKNNIKRILTLITGKENPFEVDTEGVIIEMAEHIVEIYLRLKYPSIYKREVIGVDIIIPEAFISDDLIFEFFENWSDSLENHKRRIDDKLIHIKQFEERERKNKKRQEEKIKSKSNNKNVLDDDIDDDDY